MTAVDYLLGCIGTSIFLVSASYTIKLVSNSIMATLSPSSVEKQKTIVNNSFVPSLQQHEIPNKHDWSSSTTRAQTTFGPQLKVPPITPTSSLLKNFPKKA